MYVSPMFDGMMTLAGRVSISFDGKSIGGGRKVGGYLDQRLFGVYLSLLICRRLIIFHLQHDL